MTRYHLSNGVWKRCRAVTRTGYGVAYCDTKDADGNRLDHRTGLEGIAAAGGGVVERALVTGGYRYTSVYNNADGTFTAETESKQLIYAADGTQLKARKYREDLAAKLPEKISVTPKFQAILHTGDKEWLALPWKKREGLIEEALDELLEVFESKAEFEGWSIRGQNLGTTRFWETGEVSIILAQDRLRVRGAHQVADTLLHEVAHSILPARQLHGSRWWNKFAQMKEQVGMSDPVDEAASTKSKEERLAEARLTWPFGGVCLQGHRFYFQHYPKTTLRCNRGVCRDLSPERARIRIGNNTERDLNLKLAPIKR